MTQKFSNNARSRLVGALSAVATSFTIEAPTADLFPVGNTTDWLTKLNWFKATLEKSTGQVEIVHVGVRNSGSGVFSNVLRGQDGTTALAFDAGSTVGLRITALDVEKALSGEFDELTVSGDATFGGKLTHLGIQSRIIPVGGVIFWPFSVASIPAGFQLCDGTNGTPDMRDRFPIGAAQDVSGESRTNVTGALTKTGGSKDAVLPSHTHVATVGNQSADHSHTGSTSVAGEHTHSAAADIGGRYTAAGATGAGGASTGPAGSHSHTISTGGQSASHNHAVTNASTGVSPTNANLPPYYAGCWIQAMAYL